MFYSFKNMSVRKMNSDQTVQFVQLYKENECLWNVNSPAYRDRRARVKALTRISREMNIPGFGPRDVTQKVRNIRTVYNQELHKIEKCIKAGYAPDDVYKPRVPWFDIMDSCLGSLHVESNDNTMKECSLSVFEPKDIAESNSEEEEPRPNVEPGTTAVRDSSPEVGISPKRRRLDKLLDRPTIVKVWGAEDEQNNSTNKNNNKKETETEFDLWTRSIALQLNEMEVTRALKLQLRIQTIVSNERLEYERNKQRQKLQSSTTDLNRVILRIPGTDDHRNPRPLKLRPKLTEKNYRSSVTAICNDTSGTDRQTKTATSVQLNKSVSEPTVTKTATSVQSNNLVSSQTATSVLLKKSVFVPTVTKTATSVQSNNLVSSKTATSVQSRKPISSSTVAETATSVQVNKSGSFANLAETAASVHDNKSGSSSNVSESDAVTKVLSEDNEVAFFLVSTSMYEEEETA